MDKVLDEAANLEQLAATVEKRAESVLERAEQVLRTAEADGPARRRKMMQAGMHRRSAEVLKRTAHLYRKRAQDLRASSVTARVADAANSGPGSFRDDRRDLAAEWDPRGPKPSAMNTQPPSAPNL